MRLDEMEPEQKKNRANEGLTVVPGGFTVRCTGSDGLTRIAIANVNSLRVPEEALTSSAGKTRGLFFTEQPFFYSRP